MTVKLNNEMSLSPLVVYGSPMYYQGASRDALSFVFPSSEGLDYLDIAFSAENCENITIIDDEGNENVHEGYTVRTQLMKEAVETKPADAFHEAEYEDRITVTMAQRTYMETQLAQLQAAIALLNKG